MILFYSVTAFSLFYLAWLGGAIAGLKCRVSRLEGLRRTGCFLYKPLLTVHEQIAEELHLPPHDEKRS